MYAALDLHEKSIQCVLKDDAGKVMRESKVAKDEKRILEFLDGTNASVVMESGYNHQHIRDVLKEKGYDVKVAHPLMVKAIAYAKVKTDTYVDGQAGSPLLLPAFGSNGVAINLAPLGCEGAGDNPALSPQTHTNARRRNLTILR